MNFERSSGILLPVASLPGRRLGDDARRFVDWLSDAGQRWWQILPFGPPDAYGSPDASASAFAGAPSWLGAPNARVTGDEIEQFVAAHAQWAAGWAAFAGPGALADQVRFTREWGKLRTHAAERGVRIMGDLSFYVADGSADHLGAPELFKRGVVGGVPPDDWSANGQRWGTPVYDWGALRAQHYRWWTERFRRNLELVDALRIDHFRGFVAAWEVPAQNRTARAGRWVRGPGAAPFEAATAALGDVPLVAENLGLITPAVERLRRRLGVPGTIVLQFTFADGLVHPHGESTDGDDVVYTGTHDNDTSVGWWRAASEDERDQVRRQVEERGLTEDEPHWMLIRLALERDCVVSVVPAQDVLGLGSEARLNVPGRARGNWAWHLERGQLTPHLARRLRDATEAAGRS
ncbi:MAG: 4-alpha-glucanotransferase [Actinomycetota bacterium]|nr:4-alpha-glucanotransferase [Actinomycetota bacterium]